MGRWSASHWKTAVFGWLAFVVLVLLRRHAGRHQARSTQTDANVGESRTADRIIDDAGFTVDKNGETIEEQSEMVLVAVEDADREGSGLPGRDRGRRQDRSAQFPQVTQAALAARRPATPA